MSTIAEAATAKFRNAEVPEARRERRQAAWSSAALCFFALSAFNKKA
jgi:hypothetical protein